MASVSNNFQQSARRSALIQGFLRIETIIVLVISLIMATLCWLNVFWLPETWWLWLLMGGIGACAMAWTSTRDPKLVRNLANDIVHEEISADTVRIAELQAGVARALYQHRSILKLMAARTEDFGNLSASLDEWVTRVYTIARGMDTILQHPRVLEHFYSVMDHNHVKDANLDSITSFNNAAALVTANHVNEEADEDYNKLILARDVVAQSREAISQTIDHVVSINEVLRHTRAMTLTGEHVTQMMSMLSSELDTLAESQRAVAKLAAAYEVELN